MKTKVLALLVNAALIATVAQAIADQGPSTAVAPYLQPMVPGVKITSILTTGEFVGGYKMGGIPDGLGAYDNGNGTFTVLMNHEIFANTGVPPLGKVRAHGGTGAYVSMWVIDKKTLAVQFGEDLMKRVYQQDARGAWVPVPAAGALGGPIRSRGSALPTWPPRVLLSTATKAHGTACSSITKDEETSGVIDITEILGRKDGRIYNLFVAQNHALSGDPETIEGGQLLLMSQPAPQRDRKDSDQGDDD